MGSKSKIDHRFKKKKRIDELKIEIDKEEEKTQSLKDELEEIRLK